MDPLSQGVLGASLPQSIADKKHIRWATVIGFLGGLLPDADVLIQSESDPLLYLEFHRQFTHSLFFIPFGGLICALLLYPFLKNRLSFKYLYVFSTLGYATHGVLDACTTYGTQLFWPFSNMRVAWNYISIIDPIFTLPILILILMATFRRSKKWAMVALGWAAFYIGLGAVQHQRALKRAVELAHSRGHQTLRVDAKPSFANILLWKTVYETKDHYHIDAVWVFVQTEFFEGDKVQKLDLKRDFPELSLESQQAIDVERFRWFSNGYLAVYPGKPHVIGDVRYSMVPNEIEPLWGIVIDTSAPQSHVQFESFRDIGGRHRFFEMLGLGRYFQRSEVK